MAVYSLYIHIHFHSYFKLSFMFFNHVTFIFPDADGYWRSAIFYLHFSELYIKYFKYNSKWHIVRKSCYYIIRLFLALLYLFAKFQTDISRTYSGPHEQLHFMQAIYTADIWTTSFVFISYFIHRSIPSDDDRPKNKLNITIAYDLWTKLIKNMFLFCSRGPDNNVRPAINPPFISSNCWMAGWLTGLLVGKWQHRGYRNGTVEI